MSKPPQPMGHDDLPLSSSRPKASLILILGLFCGLVVLFELVAQQISATTADAATALLEGKTIASGGLLLHGWALSLDSFWGLEALFYAVGVRIFGVHLYLLHLIPAFIAAAIVFVGVWLSALDLPRRGAIAAGIFVFVLLGFPSPDLAYFFLQGPWHVATALACVVALVLLIVTQPKVVGRKSWRPMLAVVLLAIALLSDTTTFFLGVAPLFGVGIVHILRSRRFRSGAPFIGVAFGSVALGVAVHYIGRALGMFVLIDRSLVISPHQLLHNLDLLAPRVASLFGIGNLPLAGIAQSGGVFEIVRWTILAAVLIAGLVGLYRSLRIVSQFGHAQAELSRGQTIETFLLLGIFGDLIFYVFGSANGHVEFTKYLTPGVLYLVFYAGRSLGGLSTFFARDTAMRVVSVLGLIGAIFMGIQAISRAVMTSPPQKTHQLAIFLAQHHLGNGVASYPIAALVSVDSSLKNVVRPVESNNAGRLVSFDRQRDSAWYQSENFRYLIYDTSVPWHGVDLKSATKTFGVPERRYAVGPYRVLVWTHEVKVSLNVAQSKRPLRVIFRS